MTIQIKEAELEALIQQFMASGHFSKVEDVLLAAMKSLARPEVLAVPTPEATLDEMFAKVRGLFVEDELDLRRDRSLPRTVEFS